MKIGRALWFWGASVALLSLVFAIGAFFGLYFYYSRDLPDIDSLKRVQYQVPLMVFDRHGVQFAEYGKKRRIPLTIEQIPLTQQQAFVAIEDARFYEHAGVDPIGILRAGIKYLMTGQKKEGASTITMQVARNFFLTPEKTFERKLREIFIALKIEQEVSKDEVLLLYLNKIYLGNRAYGVGAAASVYYGKPLDELSLAQQAMIAGLPKAPSKYNPIINPERARIRRDYVLQRMYESGFIDEQSMLDAQAEPISAELNRERFKGVAPYVGEMVRAQMVEEYGEAAYTSGLQVHTTVDLSLQQVAEQAVVDGLLAYDRRHGWRGPEGRVPDGTNMDQREALDTVLDDYGTFAGLIPAVVLEAKTDNAVVYTKNGLVQRLVLQDHEWAGEFVNESVKRPAPKAFTELIQPGDVVRVSLQASEGQEDARWQLAQIPAVSGALLAMNPKDGALLAVSGGFDFYYSKFNRATQAERQPGSVFKPFIYLTALDNGYTPASIINDAPVVFEDDALETSWRPENYGGRVYGPTRLREALKKSRNLVSIRLMRALGIRRVLSSVRRFGFDTDRLPADLSLSLGSGTAKPIEIVRAYGVFANGGFLVEPYFIQRVDSYEGEALFVGDPLVACDAVCLDSSLEENGPEQEPRFAPRIISPELNYQMVSMMRDVIQAGTGAKARSLGRQDLAGKTGTTNDQQDAWFSGYNGDVVATTWIGFDQVRPMGRGETGAGAALPMWIDFMRVALQGLPETPLVAPEGMVTVRIDPATGLLANPAQTDAIFETFRAETVPKEEAFLADTPGTEALNGDPQTAQEADVVEQLF